MLTIRQFVAGMEARGIMPEVILRFSDDDIDKLAMFEATALGDQDVGSAVIRFIMLRYEDDPGSRVMAEKLGDIGFVVMKQGGSDDFEQNNYVESN